MPIDERRHRLIDATVTLVAESGVAAATTRAIAARAGMPLASFHYAFASHQELMLATLHRLIELELTEYNGLQMHGDTLAENLASGLQEHLDDVVARRRDYRSLQELSLYVSHLPGHGGLPLRYRARRTERAVRKLNAVVDAIGAPLPMPVEDLARTIIVAADGITMAVLGGVEPADVQASLTLLLRL